MIKVRWWYSLLLCLVYDLHAHVPLITLMNDTQDPVIIMCAYRTMYEEVDEGEVEQAVFGLKPGSTVVFEDGLESVVDGCFVMRFIDEVAVQFPDIDDLFYAFFDRTIDELSPRVYSIGSLGERLLTAHMKEITGLQPDEPFDPVSLLSLVAPMH